MPQSPAMGRWMSLSHLLGCCVPTRRDLTMARSEPADEHVLTHHRRPGRVPVPAHRSLVVGGSASAALPLHAQTLHKKSAPKPAARSHVERTSQCEYR